MVPEDLKLVYWDYYQVKQEDYAYQFKYHETFGKPFAFAGGSSTWYGLVPLNRFSIYTAELALNEALKRTNRETGERMVDEVLCTMWGDNGAQCSMFTCLPTLQFYAEAQWTGDMSEEHVGKRFKACTGADYVAFLDMEMLENLPGRTTYGRKPMLPTRYLFFQDVMQGKFDAHVPEGSEAWCAECEEKLSKLAANPEKCGQYGYVFDTLKVFAGVLTQKAELGIKVRKAYLEKNVAAMKNICKETLPEVIRRSEEFIQCCRYQWMKENKAFGYEVCDIRFGGYMARLNYALSVLTEWVTKAERGELMELEELEAERIPVRDYIENDLDGVIINVNKWNQFVSASNI